MGTALGVTDGSAAVTDCMNVPIVGSVFAMDIPIGVDGAAWTTATVSCAGNGIHADIVKRNSTKVMIFIASYSSF